MRILETFDEELIAQLRAQDEFFWLDLIAPSAEEVQPEKTMKPAMPPVTSISVAKAARIRFLMEMFRVGIMVSPRSLRLRKAGASGFRSRFVPYGSPVFSLRSKSI